MKSVVKYIFLVCFIFSSEVKLSGQEVKFRQLNLNDGLSQNAVFENLKEQIWIFENYLFKLSDVENKFFSRHVYLWLSSFTNSRNS